MRESSFSGNDGNGSLMSNSLPKHNRIANARAMQWRRPVLVPLYWKCCNKTLDGFYELMRLHQLVCKNLIPFFEIVTAVFSKTRRPNIPKSFVLQQVYFHNFFVVV